MGVMDEAMTMHEFECPRCAAAISSPFHGPCDGCLAELRDKYQAEASEVAVAAYEPKMNVTPNAVALKDD